MGDRFEFSLSRKETSTFFLLPLSLRPFLSFPISSPPLPVFLPISLSLFPSRMPRRFSFSRTNSPAYLLRLCQPTGRDGDNRTRNVVIGRAICRNNCYDYRAEISFMNLDFFYVSVRSISVGKEFSIGSGTGFTGGEL